MPIAPFRSTRWLSHMRWHLLGGHVVAIAVAVAMHVPLPLAPLAGCVAILAASNIALAFTDGTAPLAAALALDIGLIAFELRISQAAPSPLGNFLLVPVVLAGMLLPRGALAGLTVLAVAAFACLSGAGVSLASFAILALFSGFLTMRTARAIEAHHLDLVKKQRIAAHAEKLASLTTLAAGAAHELGSPLGTITVAAEDLDALIEEAPAQAVEDARIIREEVARCREIVHRMNARAGQLLGELPERTTTGAILADLEAQATPRERRRLIVRGDLDASLECPNRGLVRILGNLVTNALHASEGTGAKVIVSAMRRANRIHFTVEDRGVGIPAHLRSRLGEPFLTTKSPGEGMGLGLFLSFAFAELCAGELSLKARDDGGTSAVLELPAS